jgi:hypothetical protein
VYPQRDWFELKSGEEALKHFSFGIKRNQHKYCSNCGSSVFFDPRMVEHGLAPPDLLGVNVSASIGSDIAGTKMNIGPHV